MVIQTRQPEHPVLQLIADHDYKGFYNMQIEERKQFAYAPFSRMIKLTLKHKSQEELQDAAAKLAFLLKKQLGARVLGPETPFITRIKNLYIRNILIKMDTEKDAPKRIKAFIASTFDFVVQQNLIKGLQMQADVDTY